MSGQWLLSPRCLCYLFSSVSGDTSKVSSPKVGTAIAIYLEVFTGGHRVYTAAAATPENKHAAEEERVGNNNDKSLGHRPQKARAWLHARLG